MAAAEADDKSSFGNNGADQTSIRPRRRRRGSKYQQRHAGQESWWFKITHHNPPNFPSF
jgi:hypothetical protein